MWRFAVAFVVLMRPQAALAHASVPGTRGFYYGFVHPFTVPAEVLALLACGLVFSRNMQGFDKVLGGYIVASTAAFAICLRVAPFNASLPLLVLALAAGCVLASALPLTAAVSRLVGIALGALAGAVAAPDEGALTAMVITGAGAVAGATITLIYVAAGAGWLQTTLTWRWLPIALRVIGSWIVAISVLLIALAIRTGR